VRHVVLPVFLIAIVAAGCGGGSTKTATQVKTQQGKRPLSKADYIALGDVICHNHLSRRQDLESQAVDLGALSSPGKAHQVATLLRQESTNLATEVEELDALQPPAGDIGTVQSILSLDRAKAGLIGNWAKAYDDLDAAAIRRLQIQIGVATAKTRRTARAYGFEVCGEG
jgi:hypothetical protein